MNSVGLAAALAAFLGIWIGHVSVRKVEAAAPRLWIPVVIAVVVGVALEVASVFVQPAAASVAAGIIGITVLWDALELHRQEDRIRRGHAPANPRNPRHAHILSKYPSATSQNLLKGQPSAVALAAPPSER